MLPAVFYHAGSAVHRTLREGTLDVKASSVMRPCRILLRSL